MIERFLTQTHFSSEEDYQKNLHFIIPENFNFAYDGRERLRTNLPCYGPASAERSFGSLSAISRNRQIKSLPISRH